MGGIFGILGAIGLYRSIYFTSINSFSCRCSFCYRWYNLGPVLGFLYLQIAANISANAEFFIARYFARKAIERKLKGKVANLDEKIKRHGFLTVLLIRLIPNVAWDVQNLTLGLTKVKFRDYFFATLIGIMPGSFAFVFFGDSLIKVLFNRRTFWIMGVAILIFVGIFFLANYLREKHKDKMSLKGGGR